MEDTHAKHYTNHSMRFQRKLMASVIEQTPQLAHLKLTPPETIYLNLTSVTSEIGTPLLPLSPENGLDVLFASSYHSLQNINLARVQLIGPMPVP